MSRIEACLTALRRRGETALIPFISAGDPDLGVTEALLPALAAAGADVIEIGVPFSDPVAEGPTIQRASERALRAGTTLRRVLELVKTLRPKLDVPLVLMGYGNSFLTMGGVRFAEAAREAGVDGVITVDCPLEEEPEYYEALAACDVDAILLAAPTTSEKRLATLAQNTRGFLYYVSLTGVTGARAELPPEIEENVARIRALSDVPVCVGFGISTPEQAARIGKFADGVVVGSALVERIERAASREAAVTDAADFVAALKAPLRPARGTGVP
ncbi:tryptophan synthase subunit alpha [Myxococcota bacterium]|nr:tryptophan synthase subunit alpha [Myxococcota bacterium]MCZ7618997.1 tryptophan synthase subunit alpha [Myxococcota bacterium]